MGWGGNGKGWGGNGKGGGGFGAWQPMWQKDFWGKGGGWIFKGKGKGKGKGHRDFKAEQKVWIGGIPDGVSFRELHETMKPAGAKWCECFDGNGKGTGVACFATPEDAQAALASLQGAVVGGAPLQLDVWERKPKAAATPTAL
eukprot:CAMPEP_0171063728 /NCGR_PEP_ID=MMETSP0766_2-20121228/5847_1 /TAXON_ID=439317 /ORGANISM="Gambierdiscus australes, Strain CAWD 149" /LENGTH=142 /DNA_ID=CAMNT_0011519673 /DNA_START=24 /DNA_END=452 /DNA_ORIENTATION=+